MTTALLDVAGIEVFYGHFQALWGIDLHVNKGEVVAIIGPNGSGKSTVMNVISGLVQAQSGTIHLAGERIDRLPIHERPRRGLIHVLERRHVFTKLTIEENLTIGGTLSSPSQRSETIEEVFQLFPKLKERRRQKAGTLSGGEQQMVAIARGLMGRPNLLMLDEPMIGLSPLFQQIIQETIRTINARGVTILMIEQNVQETLKSAHRAYVLESGRLAIHGTSEELLKSRIVREIFVGS